MFFRVLVGTLVSAALSSCGPDDNSSELQGGSIDLPAYQSNVSRVRSDFSLARPFNDPSILQPGSVWSCTSFSAIRGNQNSYNEQLSFEIIDGKWYVRDMSKTVHYAVTWDGSRSGLMYRWTLHRRGRRITQSAHLRTILFNGAPRLILEKLVVSGSGYDHHTGRAITTPDRFRGGSRPVYYGRCDLAPRPAQAIPLSVPAPRQQITPAPTFTPPPAPTPRLVHRRRHRAIIHIGSSTGFDTEHRTVHHHLRQHQHLSWLHHRF